MSKKLKNLLAEFDEPDVVQKLVGGDQYEFRRLFEKAVLVLAARIKGILKAIDLSDEEARDIAVDALVNAYENLPTKFKPEQGKFSHWLFVIAFNKARNHKKWVSRFKRDPFVQRGATFTTYSDNQDLPSDENIELLNLFSVADEKFSKEKLDGLRKAVEHLDISQQHAVAGEALKRLSYEEQFVLIWRLEVSDKEIGEGLDITEGYVPVIRTRAFDNWIAEIEKVKAS